MKHDPSPIKPLMLAIVAALAAATPVSSVAAGSDPRVTNVTNYGTVPTTGMTAGSAPTTGMVAGTTPTTSTTAATTPTTGTAAEGQPAATSTTTLSAGQLRVAGRLAAPFATLAGSSDNALALATALRTATPATLSTTSTDASGAIVVTTTSINPPTKPMGWGNVSHSLALAQFALTDAGVANPTAADLQTALLGGTVTGKDGATVTLPGVLQQRADGMGWGKIAKSYGTTMGAVNHALHASAKAPVMPAPSRTATSPTAAGMTTQRATGVTTAAGATGGGSSGIVSAAGRNGSGNAFGRGVVTASGDSATAGNSALHRAGGARGVVTAAGGTGADVASAKGASGNGNANGHGKGKAGG